MTVTRKLMAAGAALGALAAAFLAGAAPVWQTLQPH